MSIKGIIIGESRKSGVVLLQHKDDLSLESAVDEYLDVESHHPCWYALFAIENFKGFGKRTKKLKDLVGRIVLCDLQRSESYDESTMLTRWYATLVEEAKGEKPHILPNFQSHFNTKKRTAERKGGDRITRRMERRNQVSPDNLRHPWRG